MTKTFGERLKMALELRGKRPIDLANELNLHKSNVSMYISGKRKMPKLATIEKFANYLNVDVAFLLGLQDNISGKSGKLLVSIIPELEKENEIKRELIREIGVVCSYESVDNLRVILNVIKTLAKGQPNE